MSFHRNLEGEERGEVTIILSAMETGQDLLMHPERRIVLSREKQAVTIGRASKVSSKGLVPAVDNLWYDSPVMSRNHAEITADLDAQAISIRDLGSLHGTFLNGTEIPKDAVLPMKDGDNIRFGVGIDRGHERFCPMTVKLGLASQTDCSDQPVRFEVPEDSEVDDVESEADDNRSAPACDDLNDDPAGANCIDLTSPAGPRSPAAAPSDPTVTVDARGIETHEPNSAASPASSDGIDYADSDVDPSDLSDEGLDIDHEDSDEDDDPYLDGDGDDPDVYSDIESGRNCDSPSLDAVDSDASANDVLLGDGVCVDGPVDTDEELGSGVWDEADSDSSEGSDDDEHLDSPSPRNAHISLPPFGSTFEGAIFQNSKDAASPSEAVPPSFLVVREPSPSDAALPRSIQASCHLSSGRDRSLLGGHLKSHEFFVAREENKTKAAGEPRAGCSNSISGRTDYSLCHSTADIHQSPAQVNGTPSTHPESTNSRATYPATNLIVSEVSALTELSPLLASGQQFLNSPLPVVVPEAPASDEEAMGSAVAFEMSKRRQRAKPVVDCAPAVPLSNISPAVPSSTGPRRVHLGINDILEQQPKAPLSPRPHTPKRKAMEISDTTPEELSWSATGTNSKGGPRDANSSKPPTTSSPTMASSDLEPSVLPSPPLSVASPDSPARPTKRLRNIAKQAGLAALGGVTVGAMVFSSMVYMAPNF